MRTFLAFLFIIVMLNPVCSQDTNYPDIFADDWKKAMDFEKENRNWMESLLVKNNIPYELAIAVIFPELIRYSALHDKMEVSLLKTLYVSLGDSYANFSIGRFQMKPSFAEMIREQAPYVMDRKSKIVFNDKSNYDDIRNFRKSIVSDLEDTEIQLKYLIAFFKICNENFNLKWKSEAFRVKFLATAYNYGFEKSFDQIKRMMNKKFFSTKLFKTDKNYSYADISLYWYLHYKPEN